MVTGDFNQWDIQNAFTEFRDIAESSAGPARGTRTIDRTFSNLQPENIKKVGTLNPLQTDDVQAKESDHRVFFMTTSIRRQDRYKWLKYSYRYNNEESSKKFGEWLVRKDWAELVQTPTSNAKAEMYQREINWAIENFFPLRTTRRRSIDPPWINKAVKKLIKSCKRTFANTGGRTAEWKCVKER